MGRLHLISNAPPESESIDSLIAEEPRWYMRYALPLCVIVLTFLGFCGWWLQSL